MSDSLQPGLILIHGNQAEALRNVLIQWIKTHPLHPLENETILVHSNGIAQWLKTALAAPASAGGCSIAAGLDFVLPMRFCWQAYRDILGHNKICDISPLSAEGMHWRLLRLLPQFETQPNFAPLQLFLADDTDGQKHYQLAQRLAVLFEQYQIFRADWLQAWQQGRDIAINANGVELPLSEEQCWQPILWRQLISELPNNGAYADRATVHREFIAHSRQMPTDQRPAGLPRRVMVFGLSSLAPQALNTLATVAKWSQVLLFVVNPSRYYWADCLDGKELLRSTYRRQHKKTVALPDDTLSNSGHPLLASWGKQGRDFIALLDEYDDPTAHPRYAAHLAALGQRIDLFHAATSDSLLHQLQNDILELNNLAEIQQSARRINADHDHSICFHSAHSALRETEILRDQLLELLQQDPSLQPRDIIVMVPDIAAYTPFIEAVFGIHTAEDHRHIPFSIADKTLRHQNALVIAIEFLLHINTQRLQASDILSLLDVPALRNRFQIEEDSIGRFKHWLQHANIHWGLHQSHRAQFDMPPTQTAAAPYSWLFGIRRLLLGYAVDDSEIPWQDIAPFTPVSDADAEQLGHLILLLEYLEQWWQTARYSASPSQWAQQLRELLSNIFTASSDAETQILARFDNSLNEWEGLCDDACFDQALPLSIVAEHLLTHFEPQTLSKRFFAGAVTFATLMPMRAIPFRVVCLLGMNDKDFPRSQPIAEFDLMHHHYRLGDRSRRDDDRYLFLEALLSARDKFYLSWVGSRITDNSVQPPSVLLQQLQEHIDQGWHNSTGTQRLSQMLTCVHPLHPFSLQYWLPTPTQRALFTYSHEWRDAPTGQTATASAPLPHYQRTEPLTLNTLANFLNSPVKSFFRERLNVFFPKPSDKSLDTEIFKPDGLQAWQLGTDLIQSLQQHNSPETINQWLAMQQRCGNLPQYAWGHLLTEELRTSALALFTLWQTIHQRWPILHPRHYELGLTLPLGPDQALTLNDLLSGLQQSADGQRCVRIHIRFSRILQDKSTIDYLKLIPFWIQHLAWQQVGAPPVTTLIIGRDKGGRAQLLSLQPIAAAEAGTIMQRYAEIWLEGMSRPLPLAPKSTIAYLVARHKGKSAADAHQQAAKIFGTRQRNHDTQIDTEWLDSPYLQRAWAPSFDALSADPRWITLATDLYQPLIDHLHIGFPDPLAPSLCHD